LKRAIQSFNPAIVHAHYATSYGLLGKLSQFQPLIISVWGSDVFEFPQSSFLHKYLLKSNLAAACRILSTSHVMAEETRKYLAPGKVVEITPFGIDLVQFYPSEVNKGPEITIGTIKALMGVYGIDTLLRAFCLLQQRLPDILVKLVIVGDGEDREKLIGLAKTMKINASVEFVGKIDHQKVPETLNSFDIFAALSNHESFGVAVIEASACELPVVVSNAGGLPEVVENGVTGIVVPKRDAEKAAEALEKLVLDSELRKEMGEAGRKRIEKLYDWKNNVKQMIDIYKKVDAQFAISKIKKSEHCSRRPLCRRA
jgi:glycosyltransferase involved in cell wall biosynthesis